MRRGKSSLLLTLLLAVAATASAASAPAVSIDDLIESNHWKQALQAVQSRINSNPSDAQAHAWMSKIKESFGDLAASLAEAQKAVDLDARNPEFHGQLAEACAMTADISHVLKSLVYVHCMKREVELALTIDPRNINTMLVEMMFSLKAPGIAGGDKARARKISDDIRNISPSWGYLAAARLLQDMDNDPVKEDLLNRAVEADPKFYRARMALATFYAINAHQKRPEQAEKLAKGMIALDPSNEGGYEILARVYAAGGHWAELDEILEKASKAVPEDAGPYYAAADALNDSGMETVRGERYLEKYLSQPPEGRQPGHAKARWLLAKFYSREGKTADAIRELQTAVHLDPSLEPAQKDLKRLLHS